MSLGNRIAQKRKSLGLSQEQLAEALSVSRSAVAKWESNNGTPDIENLKALSKMFDISIDELIGNVTEAEQKVCQENDPAEKFVLGRSSKEKFKKYISKRCFVDLVDWNDGFAEGYVIGQDEDFLYYVVQGKQSINVGLLAKKYIKEVEILKEAKNPLDLSPYESINRQFFVGKYVTVNLNERRFLDGIFGKDTEFHGAEVLAFSEDKLVLQIGNQIAESILELSEVTRIETTMI